MADMVFCVADLVVADMVCGRYRLFFLWNQASISLTVSENGE